MRHSSWTSPQLTAKALVLLAVIVVSLLLCLSYYARHHSKELPARKLSAKRDIAQTAAPAVSEAEGDVGICAGWIARAKRATECIKTDIQAINLTEAEFWPSFESIVRRCSGDARRGIKLRLFKNLEDKKDFFDFFDTSIQASCVAVTVGIGNDITNEEQIRRTLPLCKFYGAEPMQPAGEIFKRIGALFPFAISNKTGYMQASVLSDIVEQRYSVENVYGIELVEFLRRRANLTHVDFLLLDAEGVEYRLLPYFYRNGALDKAKISVCQMSLELHGPPEAHGFASPEDWQQTIERFIGESDFLPLWAETNEPHFRMLLVNWSNLNCFRRFYRNRC